jgi:hypothetical protein
MKPMDRREFAALLPALLAGCELVPDTAEAQTSLPMLESGVYPPSPSKAGSQAGHASSRYLMGMLRAGNIRLEMHESTIRSGTNHEPGEYASAQRDMAGTRGNGGADDE